MFCRAEHGLSSAIVPDTVCVQCCSPLFPAKKQDFEQSCQRAILRIDKQWPVEFYTRWPQSVPFSGNTQDVSLNGMQLLTTQSMPEHRIIKISSQFLDAVARVVNRQVVGQTNSWRVGLAFITLRFHHTNGTFVSAQI